MKKMFFVVIFMVGCLSIYSVELHPSIGVVSNLDQTPIYAEIALSHTVGVATVYGSYLVGYDIYNKEGYSAVNFRFSLNLDWGNILFVREYGNNVNQTKVKVRF